MEQTVSVHAVERKSGSSKKGPWFFDIVDADNLKFQTKFNEGFTVDPGTTVKITYHEEQRDNFTNLVIDSYSAVAGSSTNGNGSQAVASHNHSSKDEQIARAVAFKGAIDLASGGVLDPDVETILGVTEAFYSYLTTGQLEPETADTRH